MGKFSRMQDTLVDKLLPALLRAVGEPVGSAIDKLHRAEAIGILEQPGDWLAARMLRNRLVPETIDDVRQLAEALETACGAASALHDGYRRVLDYCVARPDIARPTAGQNMGEAQF